MQTLDVASDGSVLTLGDGTNAVSGTGTVEVGVTAPPVQSSNPADNVGTLDLTPGADLTLSDTATYKQGATGDLKVTNDVLTPSQA